MSDNNNRPTEQPDGTHTGMGGPGAAKPIAPVVPAQPTLTALS